LEHYRYLPVMFYTLMSVGLVQMRILLLYQLLVDIMVEVQGIIMVARVVELRISELAVLLYQIEE